jgi:hypothetical protein
MKRKMEMEGDRKERRKERPGRRCISEYRCEQWNKYLPRQQTLKAGFS